MKKSLFLLLCACAFGSGVTAQAQDKKPTWVLGVYTGPIMFFGLGIQFHSFDFPIPPFPPSSSLFIDSDKPMGNINSGYTSTGINAGLLLENRINSWLGWGLRVGVNGFGQAELSGTDTNSSNIKVYPRDGSNIPVNATSTRRTLLSILNYYDIAPYLIFPDLLVDNLYLTVGPDISISKEYPTYVHMIKLEQPSSTEYTFSDGSDALYSPDLPVPNNALRLAADLGIGYNIPLSKGTWLAPEVKFSFPFTKVSSNDAWDSWTVSQLRFSIVLRFDISGSDDKSAPPATTED